jgi:peptide/nickel transport system permease protein
MLSYIVRRVLLAIPVLLGILFVTFTVARLLPGDPCHAMLQEKATPEVCAEFNRRFGLDKPIPAQFLDYIVDALQANFGSSIQQGRPVTELLAERLPTTLELSLGALLFSVVIGIPLGIISAYWRNSAIDVGTMLIANIGVSMPVFWLGLMLAYAFAVLLRGTPLALPPSHRASPGLSPAELYTTWNIAVTPGTFGHWILTFFSNLYIFNSLITGQWDKLWDAIRHLILPATALGTIPMALIARMTRSSLLEVLGLDYVRVARAKGLLERAVVLRHAFRNAMLPVATVVGLELGYLMGGAMLTETIFGLNGVGTALLTAITARDYQVIQAFTLVVAIIFVVVNLGVDLLYGFLDPRVRYE